MCNTIESNVVNFNSVFKIITVSGVLGLAGCGGVDSVSPAPLPNPPATPACSMWEDQAASTLVAGDGEITYARFISDCEIMVAIKEAEGVNDSDQGRIVRIADGVNRQAEISFESSFDTPASDSILGFRHVDDTLYMWGITTGAIDDSAVNEGREDAVFGTLDTESGEFMLTQWGTECPDYPMAMYSDNVDWFVWGYHDVCIVDTAVLRWQDIFVLNGSMDSGKAEISYDYSRLTLVADIASVGTPIDGDYAVSVLELSGPGSGLHILRLDRMGNEIWSTHLSHSPIDFTAHMVVREGALYVVGTTYIQLGEQGFGGGDIFIAKLDPASGDVQSITQYGTERNEWLTDAKYFDGSWWFTLDYQDEVDIWNGTLYELIDDELTEYELPDRGDYMLTKGVDVNGKGVMVYGTYYDGDISKRYLTLLEKAQ